MKLTITKDNFEFYLKVFEVFHKNLFGHLILSDSRLSGLSSYDPIEKIQTFRKENPKIAKVALKEGIRESITMIDHYPAQTKLQIDNELKENNLGSLYQLVSLVKDTVAKVLKNQRIKNLDEYYIIKEKLDDLTSELSQDNREILGKYLIEFESKNEKNNYR